jgi:hypothetical protein
MAKPSTTHVIEIESGIGEPGFIPLTLGQELQPLSLGKKGMWRIESPRVLDVHAFVYFDGNSLFLQSADETAAAVVEGFKVGKGWTELHAPCRIEIGQARLRFRSLLAEADEQPTMLEVDDNETTALGRAPVAPPPGFAATLDDRRRGSGAPAQPSRPAPGMSAPPPPVSSGPMTFAKADRPFRPGEFVTSDDESTRFAPLEATGANRAMARPSAGRLPDEEAMRGMTGAMPVVHHSQGDPYGMMPNMPPGMQGPPPGMQGAPLGMHGAPGPYPGGPVHPGGPGGGGYPPPGGGPGYPYGYPPNAMPPGMAPGSGPSMIPGGYGSPALQTAPVPAQPGGDSLAEKWNALPRSTRIALAASPLFLASAFYLLTDDPEPAPKRPVAAADAGAATGSDAAAAQSATATAQPPPSGWPAGVPFPPPGWPAGVPYPYAAPSAAASVPAAPIADAAPTPAPATSAPSSSAAPVPTPPPRPASSKEKTLERQAVDLVAEGDYAKAADLYRKLVAEDPTNPAYSEALRILQARLDGGP